MSQQAQKQDMHGQKSKIKWLQDHLIAPVKDLLKPGSRSPSPSPQSTSPSVKPATGTQDPLGVPIISTQGVAMVISTEGSASPLNTTGGADVVSGTANQAGIGSGNSGVSITAPSKTIHEAISSSDTPGSKAKDALQTAWHGLKLILGQAEGLLEGTPFQTPVAAVNMIIELADAVNNNYEMLEELMTRIKTKVDTIGTDLVTNDSADLVSTKMKENFIKILLEDFSKLNKLKSKKLWRDIFENEQDMEEIQRILRNVDDNTKNFQVQVILHIERNTAKIFESLVQNQFKDWPRSRKAIYNADLEEETKFSRGPCTPDTRVSILEKIYQWAQGSGKSTIAYTVAQHFDNQANKLPCILQATFFCSRQFNDTKLQQFIIPTLVYQLAQNSKLFANSFHETNNFNSVDILSKHMKDLLVDPWQKSVNRYTADYPLYLIVIDALDEIEGKKGSAFLEELITTIKNGYLHGFKFLVTSRPDSELAQLYESFHSDAVCHLYNVAKEDVQKDIEKYLYCNLKELEDDPGLVHLAQKADGLFIYASTAMKYIPYPKGSTQMEQQKKTEKASCTS